MTSKTQLKGAVAVIYPDHEGSITRMLNDPCDRLKAVVETGTSIDLSTLVSRVNLTV